LSVTIEDTSFDDSGAIKTVMVNTNQVSILHNLISRFIMLIASFNVIIDYFLI